MTWVLICRILVAMSFRDPHPNCWGHDPQNQTLSSFGTLPPDLYELANWLAARRIYEKAGIPKTEKY